jgi:hypothetical protein
VRSWNTNSATTPPAQTIAELKTEIVTLKELEKLASSGSQFGQHAKWSELTSDFEFVIIEPFRVTGHKDLKRLLTAQLRRRGGYWVWGRLGRSMHRS